MATTKAGTSAKKSTSINPRSRKRPAPDVINPQPRKRQDVDADGKIIGSYSSLADRRRRAPTCSLASLRELEDEDCIDSDFIARFGISSDSHYTWGKTEIAPIVATKKKGRQSRLRRQAGSGKQDIAAYYGGHEESPEPEPNSPDRSILRRFPLEIRERIYGIFLLYDKPIIVKYDLRLVERVNLRTHPLLRVCKQISEETSSFIYRQNVFRTILRTPLDTYHLHEYVLPKTFVFPCHFLTSRHTFTLSIPAILTPRPTRSFTISPKFPSLIRNIVIECVKDNWNTDWYEKATLTLRTLVTAKTVLSSLTLVIIPQKVGLSETALDIIESNPITFADFLWYSGPLMEALRNIPCKIFNIVVKIPIYYPIFGPENDPRLLKNLKRKIPTEIVEYKRYLISMDLTYLARAGIEEGALNNEETVRMKMARNRDINMALRGLKKRVEEIAEDEEKALMEGKCRRLADEEKIQDAFSLAEKN